MNNKKGFVLIEVLIAIVVFSTIVLSVVPMLSFLLRRTARSKYEAQAGVLLQEGMEASYNALTTNWNSYLVDGDYKLSKTSTRWILSAGSEENIEARFKRQIQIKRACRDEDGKLLNGASSCPVPPDNNSKILKVTVEWEDEGEIKNVSGELLVLSVEQV